MNSVREDIKMFGFIDEADQMNKRKQMSDMQNVILKLYEQWESYSQNEGSRRADVEVQWKSTLENDIISKITHDTEDVEENVSTSTKVTGKITATTTSTIKPIESTNNSDECQNEEDDNKDDNQEDNNHTEKLIRQQMKIRNC